MEREHDILCGAWSAFVLALCTNKNCYAEKKTSFAEGRIGRRSKSTRDEVRIKQTHMKCYYLYPDAKMSINTIKGNAQHYLYMGT